MKPLVASDVRGMFVNTTKGAASRIPPPALNGVPWVALDFFGWRDPGTPSAAWMVAPHDGQAVGASKRQNMCSLCHTVHSSSGVSLMVAPRAGRAGRTGNTVGTYLCTDLACSLYARGIKKPDRVQPSETMSPEAKVARLQLNLETFVRRVLTAT
jgi:hypothetical protein